MTSTTRVELPPPDAPPIPPFPGELRRVGGRELYVRTAPAASGLPPALLVHGLGGASTNWTDVMHLLSPLLATEALDLPGFGRSDPSADGRYGLSVHTSAVIDLIESRGAGPVHLFGNSLGGAVTTRVAADRPDLVRSLTLISPALPTYLPRVTNARVPALLVPGFRQLIMRRTSAMSAGQQVQAVLDVCYADTSSVPPERVREAVEELRRRSGLPHSQDALLRSLQGLIAGYLDPGARNLWRLAARVQAPTLLIFGRLDKLIDVRIAPKAARTFPDSRLVVVDDVGHVAQMERPVLVARLVADRLRALAAREAAATGG